MTRLEGRSQFLMVLAMVAAMFLGGLALSTSGNVFGQETEDGFETDFSGVEGDLGVEEGTPSGTGGSAPTTPAAPAPAAPSGGSAVAPPQAPVDAGAGAGATGLPSAGSGGYLNDSGSSALFYALLAGLGLAAMASGSLVWAHKERK